MELKGLEGLSLSSFVIKIQILVVGSDSIKEGCSFVFNFGINLQIFTCKES